MKNTLIIEEPSKGLVTHIILENESVRIYAKHRDVTVIDTATDLIDLWQLMKNTVFHLDPKIHTNDAKRYRTIQRLKAEAEAATETGYRVWNEQHK